MPLRGFSSHLVALLVRVLLGAARMRRNFLRLCAVVVVGVLTSGRTSPAASPESPAGDALAEQQVRAALRLEALGDAGYRKILLGVALNHFGDYPPSRWHNGQVQVDGEWLTLAEAEARATRDERFAEYERRRSALLASDTAEGQLDLAKWCLHNKLNDRARFHYVQIVRLPATPAQREQAARALTSRQLSGDVRAEQHSLQAQDFKRAQDEWVKWTPALRQIADELVDEDDARRSAAREKLAQADDPLLVPALEALISARGEAQSLAVVELLAGMPQHEATMSLVRHALYSPSPFVRSTATEQLVKRPMHDYLPWLMSALVSPVKSRCWIDSLPDGRFRYIHDFYRPGANRDFVFRKNKWVVPVHVTLTYQENYLDHGSLRAPDVSFVGAGWHADADVGPVTAPGAVAQELILDAAATEIDVRAFNERARRVNQRIDAVLSRATDQVMNADPVRWWTWWQDYNELQKPDRKPVAFAYVNMREAYNIGVSLAYRKNLERTYPVAEIVGNRVMPIIRIPGQSCFPRGTKVWTEAGGRPVETLRTGDRVLSQDVDTGELTYKTVLATTVRRPAPLLKVRAGGSEVTATRGHPFWVSGHGWKMAKFLAVGDNLHCAGGFAPIESIVEAPPQETYNLVVDDFATYFVGEQRLLVHDNTLRQPTLAVVPGLNRD